MHDLDDVAARTMKRVAWRILPLAMALGLVGFVDRVNVGFAALTMNHDLGLTPEQFGFGVGIFFWGYCLFELPSNLMLHRIGARVWLARIAITWGIVVVLTAFIQTPVQFYSARFLLGVAEAGCAPGVILFLTYWFPSFYRAKALSAYIMTWPIGVIVAAPLSTSLLSLDGIGGLEGWRWMFILEGLPAIVLGLLVLIYLTNRPKDATWLSSDERAWLEETLKSEHAEGGSEKISDFKTALKLPIVWIFATIFFMEQLGLYGVTSFMPQIVKVLSGATDFGTGMITAVPYLIGLVALLAVSYFSDKIGQPHILLALSSVAVSVGLTLAAITASPLIALAGLTLCISALMCILTLFWILPMRLLNGRAAAGCIAVINSLAMFGGFFGPYVMGVVKERTGAFAWAYIGIALLFLIIAFVWLAIGRRENRAIRYRQIDSATSGL